MKTVILSPGTVLGREAAITRSLTPADYPAPGSRNSPVKTTVDPPTAIQTRRRAGWVAAVSLLMLLILTTMAVKIVRPPESPVVASYNTRLAALDAKLSRELTQQLQHQGVQFDTALVSVEPPACEQAVCLLKRLMQSDTFLMVGGVSGQHDGDGRWSFVGSGGLAGLDFEVDAAVEMQRLAASTPPDFPSVVVSRRAVVRPTGNFLGREFELVLPASPQRAQPHWLDLETGRCVTEPDPEYFINSGSGTGLPHWLVRHGLDLCVVVLSDASYRLVTSRMNCVPVDGQLWEAATTGELAAHPALVSPAVSGRHINSPARDRTDTYLFRTDQGTVGLLRVLDFNSAPPQLKIRYRLAAEEVSATSTREPLRTDPFE